MFTASMHARRPRVCNKTFHAASSADWCGEAPHFRLPAAGPGDCPRMAYCPRMESMGTYVDRQHAIGEISHCANWEALQLRVHPMFVLCTLEDKLRVQPGDLGRPTLEAVTAEIERTYIDKVVPDLGLVITLYDILDVSGGYVFPSDGAAHFDTKFRLVVFKPFIGEVLVGKLKACDKQGLQVDLGFFSDLHVPDYHCPEDYWFHSQDGLWAWKYDGNDLFLDLKDDIRVRVMDVKFHPVPNEVERKGNENDPNMHPKGTTDNPFSPMTIIASVKDEGLGMISWWGDGEE